MHARSQQSAEMRDCIEQCTSCHSVCLDTINYCLEEGGEHAAPAHIRLLIDCADMCRTAADFMIRGSELHAAVCRACAEFCERCADDCARFSDDEHMQQCAQACRRCAESCLRMASVGAAA
jgi:hypothetical protein